MPHVHPAAVTMLGALLLAGPVAAAETADPTEGVAFFEKKIRPVLVERCYSCHSEKAAKAKGGLRLDSQQAMQKGGESGPALVPGNPEASLLMKAIRYASDELEMPPAEADRLNAQEISDFETWIKIGAPDPRVVEAAAPAAPKPPLDVAAARQFWSFQPPKKPAVPAISNRAWAKTPIDEFVLARLEEKGLSPGADADRRALLRRATFDLTGLPPTPQEMRAFLADRSPHAFAKVVDRLLASRHYGERWGRHWLDVARYADTAGDQADFPIPQAWRYRNWVVKAINADKPYNEFLREQLAGDLLTTRSEAERHERIIATGYIALARRFQVESQKYMHLTIEDAIDTLGRSVLGLSLSCARCHDHKFDPIPTDDYYALYGIFASTRLPFPGSETATRPTDLVPLAPPAQAKALLEPFEAKVKALDAEIKRFAKEKNKAAETDAKKRLQAVLAAPPPIPMAFAVIDGAAQNARVQKGGDPTKLGDEIPRRFLQVLGGQRLTDGAKGSGRLQLAAWLTDRSNPLTARVIVNRIWLHHFGKGLVRTPNDFGVRGQPPTHPELLDYLAVRFIEGGWSMKKLHRSIMLSRVYQLGTYASPAALEVDPDNQLLARFNRQRLDAESLRDALLAVSGDLDRSSGEGHPFPPQHEWKFNASKPFLDVYETQRRGIYQMTQRMRKAPFFETFDGADGNVSTPERAVTTTPLQALYFMNSGFVAARAEHLADRVCAAAAVDEARIALAYETILGRPPTSEERRDAEGYLQSVSTASGARTAWTSYMRALLASNEFSFID